MKRVFFGILGLVLLAACSSQTTVRYNLAFDVTAPTDQQALTLASEHVIENRLDALSEPLIDKEIDTKDNTTSIVITVPDKGAADELTKELTAPFKMEVMAQTASGKTADVTVQGQGSFSHTNITEKDLQWVQSHKDADGKGEVALAFTDAGRAKMKALLLQMRGKDIGIFVRDRLVSKLHVKATVIPDTIVISGIPSFDVANVFADDMNVGLHVTFTVAP